MRCSTVRFMWLVASVLVASCAAEAAKPTVGTTEESPATQLDPDCGAPDASGPGDVGATAFELRGAVATGGYVFVAAPGSATVFRVDAKTLKAIAVPVKPAPMQIAVAPQSGTALVLHEGSSQIGILVAKGSAITTSFVTADAGFDTIVCAPDSPYAIAYRDFDLPGATNIGLQSVAVIALTNGVAQVRHASVGFRPRDVLFAAGGRALVITDDGVSVIDLAGAKEGVIAAPRPIALDTPPSQVRDVIGAGQGAWVLQRTQYRDYLQALHVSSGTTVKIPLGSVPTDMRAIPGNDGLVLVALGQADELAVVSLPASPTETISPASHIALGNGGADLIRLTDDGKGAVLFSSAANKSSITYVDLPTFHVTQVPLHKAVTDVGLSADGRVAVVIHKPGTATSSGVDDASIAKGHGYSLVSLDSGFTKLVLTTAMPAGVNFLGTRAFLTVPGTATSPATLHVVSLSSFESTVVPLTGNPAEVVAVKPAGLLALVFAGPSGNLALFDPQSSMLTAAPLAP